MEEQQNSKADSDRVTKLESTVDHLSKEQRGMSTVLDFILEVEDSEETEEAVA